MPDTGQLKSTPAELFSVKAQKLFGVFGVTLFFCVVAAVEASIPRLRHLLFQIPFFLAPTLVTAWFCYRRTFHPARVPVTLAIDSATVVKLRKMKRILAWSIAAAFLAPVISLLAACDCEHHPILAALAFFPTVAVYLWWAILTQYIKERTRQIDPPAVVGRGWPVRRLNASEFKPFYSDHWGIR